MKTQHGEFTREMLFEPAWNKGPKYGCHSAHIRFLLKGAKGAVQFVVDTRWYLAADRNKFQRPEYHQCGLCDPSATDLGYHSPVPIYAGQTVREDCPFLDGKPCYYDGSGLNGAPILDRLIEEGEDAVWQELEYYYHRTFEDTRNRSIASRGFGETVNLLFGDVLNEAEE